MPEQIANSIALAVLNGEYGPGERILEVELAAHFHVSRGPIREALRILEKSGVVTILPQRGAHVTILSPDEVNNLFEIRRDLMHLLISGVSPADAELLDDLERVVREMERLAKDPGAAEAYAQHSMQAGRLLFSACRNEKLTEILQSLSLQTARYTRLGLSELDRRRQSVLGWRKVVDALKKNQVEVAADALRTLIDKSRLAALRALRSGAELDEVPK